MTAVGRPKKAKGEHRKYPVTVRFTREEFDLLAEECSEEGLPATTYLRRLVMQIMGAPSSTRRKIKEVLGGFVER